MQARNHLLMTATSLTAVVLLAIPTSAQQATPTQATTSTSAGAKGTGVEEVVVTAEKRQTKARTTPVSLETISGKQLVTRGIRDITALAENDASLDVSYSSGYPILAVRGISTQNTTETGDPAVSVGVDGIFNNRPFGLFGGLYDVNRVEVLRGPQGTLFGRNSTGGTVNVITEHPTNTTSGELTVELGNYNLVDSQGYANIPVNDKVQVRVSFLTTTRDGYRDIPPTGQHGDDANVQSGRFQIAFEPTDSLRGWLFFEDTYIHDVGPVAQQVPFNFINGVGGEPVHQLPPNIGNGLSFPLYADYHQVLRNYDLHGTLTYTLPGEQTITYLGGYNPTIYDINQAINATYFGPQYAKSAFGYYNYQHPTTINQELRVASPANQRLTWQVGAYYFEENSNLLAGTNLNPNTPQQTPGVAFIEPKTDSDSKALYGQASFAITPKLKLTAGGRYTWDRKEREYSQFLLYPFQTGLPFELSLPDDGRAESSKFTWSVDLSYEITPLNFAYAKVSTGYKAGGYNSAVSAYGPENVISYEIGSKNRFFDNHLEFDIDGYLMNYTGQQVSQFVANVENSGSITVNAGNSQLYGIESNLTYKDDTLGRLDLSGAYLHARYISFIESAGWDSSINLDLDGKTPPLSPTFSLTVQYERPFSLQSGAVITPRLSLKYQTTEYFAPNDYTDEEQKGFALLDLGLDYRPTSGRWLLQAWVKNVVNEKIFNDATEFYLFNHYELGYEPPRTYGLRLSIFL